MTPTPEPAAAGETIRQLRAERNALGAELDQLAGYLHDRDAQLAAILAATDPAAIREAIDNVYDMDTTLDDYAAAVSRAVRKSLGVV